MSYIRGAELIIHNAPFDTAFINRELKLLGAGLPVLSELCSITDTLVLAKKTHPGQRNSLDALCKRYQIDNSHRELHGALLDAEILADVYLTMTGGQTTLSLDALSGSDEASGFSGIRRLEATRPALSIVPASPDELELHEARLDAIDKSSGGNCVWKKLGQD
jgi:DNA polymerase-3 subunit epsilon